MVLRSDVKLTSHEHLKLERKQAASILLSDMVEDIVQDMVVLMNTVNKVPMSKFQLNLAKPLLLKVKQLLLLALSKVHNNIQLNGANMLMIPVFQIIFVYVEKKN